MEIRELVERAFQRDLSDPSALSDAFDSIRLLEPEDFKLAHEKNKEVRRLSAKFAAEQKSLRMFELNKRSLLFDAPYDFDAFLRYLEWDRKPEKRFYLPRRHYLKKYVDAYQEILDGKLDFLSISMPKRAGKSQLGINFVNMLSGKFPDRATLMEGTGDDLVMSFYKGCLEYLQTPNEYLFYDVFPSSKLIQTNADSKTINLLNKSRFPTIMCRSIDARQVGLSEATNLLYLDDCVEGREEAKNRNRLDAKWEVISGDILGRAIEGTPVVICGTRYSLYDPIGRLQEEMRKQRKRMKIIETPALDLITDESNFEYTRDGKKVFTTQYFRDQREMLSAEQFESEFQQQPFEAKGLLFPENELNRYFELPVDREPDAIISVCDTAEGGGDSVMMPIGYIYGEDTFIEDCVFDNSTPEVTKPQCAKKLVEHKVSVATFESNNAGTYFARDVEELVKKMGGRVSIRTRRTISNKQTRIEMASDGILKHFYFKDKSLYKPSDQYGQMMRELVTYTRTGKVKHDDSPDGLSLLENEIRNLTWGKVEVFTRPF
jgi:predicted phage terminase large subunit-like protein|nr:MAG TPA: Terminase [Caudoviricetes sp.]